MCTGMGCWWSSAAGVGVGVGAAAGAEGAEGGAWWCSSTGISMWPGGWLTVATGAVSISGSTGSVCVCGGVHAHVIIIY